MAKYESTKLVTGGIVGVVVPIVIEFGAKGAKVSDGIPVKWSGIIGTVGGGLTLVGAVALKDRFERMEPGNKHMILAFGASMFATGASILVLDELRKRQQYTFELPLGSHDEDLTGPVNPNIKEI